MIIHHGKQDFQQVYQNGGDKEKGKREFSDIFIFFPLHKGCFFSKHLNIFWVEEI